MQASSTASLPRAPILKDELGKATVNRDFDGPFIKQHYVARLNCVRSDLKIFDRIKPAHLTETRRRNHQPLPLDGCPMLTDFRVCGLNTTGRTRNQNAQTRLTQTPDVSPATVPAMNKQ